MSIHDRTVDLVFRLRRAGLKPRAISRELSEVYGINLNAAQVSIILENREADDSKADPPAAALDAILLAHKLQHEVEHRKALIIEFARRKAEADGLDELELAIRCAAAASTQDEALMRVGKMISTATAAYVASGGSRDEIDRALTIHFHTSDPVSIPTPTPGVIDG